MANGQGFTDTSGTPTTNPNQIQFEQDTAETDTKRQRRLRAECINRGGVWDATTGTCSIPSVKSDEDPNKIKLTEEEKKKEDTLQPSGLTPDRAERILDTSGESVGVTVPDGRQFLGLNQADQEKVAQRFGAAQQKEAALFQPTGTLAEQQKARREGINLSGQVGEFGSLGIDPTGFNYQEAVVEGLVSGVPNSLKMIGGAVATGGTLGAVIGGAPTGGVGAPVGAIIGGAIGAVGAISGSMIGSLKDQRRDTTTAQQRVLDEGKQTMKDWATLARNDPSNAAFYLGEYNKVAAQIDAAHRQMKLDTSQDVLKFETALPNLAEFNAFYAVGGERDALDKEMTLALLQPAGAETDMIDLYQRRVEG